MWRIACTKRWRRRAPAAWTSCQRADGLDARRAACIRLSGDRRHAGRAAGRVAPRRRRLLEPLQLLLDLRQRGREVGDALALLLDHRRRRLGHEGLVGRACRWPWPSRPPGARLPCPGAPSRRPRRSPCTGTGARRRPRPPARPARLRPRRLRRRTPSLRSAWPAPAARAPPRA